MKYFLRPKGKLLGNSGLISQPMHAAASMEEILKKRPDSLTSEEKALLIEATRSGIEQHNRAALWALLVPSSEDTDLQSYYNYLIHKSTAYEQQIVKDLARTFPQCRYFSTPNGEGQDSLLSVVKVYALYDQEVGYCQGISFIAGILLLFMPPFKAFEMLIRIMHHYDLRANFLPGMDGLHLRLFQLDQVLQQKLPTLANMLRERGIFSVMFATQWFLTLFSYKFPFELVFLILDNFFLEGPQFLFKVAVALLQRNERFLEMLEFEELLEFLNQKLYFVYMENPLELIRDACLIEISKETLDLLLAQFTRNTLLDSLDGFKAKTLLDENRALKQVIRQLEEENELLQAKQSVKV